MSAGTKASYTPKLRRQRSEERYAAWDRGCYGEAWLEQNIEGVRAAHARGCYKTPEVAQKRIEGSKQSWARGDHDGQFTEEVLAVMSEKAAANWAAGVFDGMRRNPSSLETNFAVALEACGIRYIPQYRLEGDGRPFDFFIPPRLLVEVDGTYWHGLPGAAEKDALKAELAKERGFILRRIPEQVFQKQNPSEIVQERILPIMREIDSLLGISSHRAADNSRQQESA